MMAVTVVNGDGVGLHEGCCQAAVSVKVQKTENGFGLKLVHVGAVSDG